jgi:hypothetical protein
MSLIATYINKFGVVLASDSNLTGAVGNAGFGQKVFPVPHLNAGITFTGSYEIDGNSVDIWMNEFISSSFFTLSTIEDFVKYLTESLNREMRAAEFAQGCIIHVAGYSHSDGVSFLEHWHISNMRLQDDGNYSIPELTFHFGNDFNSRTVQKDRETVILLDDNPENNQFFINGYAPGRISTMALKEILETMFSQIWNNPQWQFRKPSNLFESASLVKIYYYLVSELFKMSNHHALIVGGETQTYLISVPQNLDKSDWA